MLQEQQVCCCWNGGKKKEKEGMIAGMMDRQGMRNGLDERDSDKQVMKY